MARNYSALTPMGVYAPGEWEARAPIHLEAAKATAQAQTAANAQRLQRELAEIQLREQQRQFDQDYGLRGRDMNRLEELARAKMEGDRARLGLDERRFGLDETVGLGRLDVARGGLDVQRKGVDIQGRSVDITGRDVDSKIASRGRAEDRADMQLPVQLKILEQQDRQLGLQIMKAEQDLAAAVSPRDRQRIALEKAELELQSGRIANEMAGLQNRDAMRKSMLGEEFDRPMAEKSVERADVDLANVRADTRLKDATTEGRQFETDFGRGVAGQGRVLGGDAAQKVMMDAQSTLATFQSDFGNITDDFTGEINPEKVAALTEAIDRTFELNRNQPAEAVALQLKESPIVDKIANSSIPTWKEMAARMSGEGIAGWLGAAYLAPLTGGASLALGDTGADEALRAERGSYRDYIKGLIDQVAAARGAESR